jgi:hypothetical protein
MAKTRSDGEDPTKREDAESDQGEAQRQADREARRAAYERDMEQNLRENGNLTAQEIQQLLTFECREAPSSVE